MEKITLNPIKGLKKYYEEYPKGEFLSSSDESALKHSKAKVLYRENDTPNGLPFIMLREDK